MKPKRTTAGIIPPGGNHSPGQFPKQRELIVVAKPHVELRSRVNGLASASGTDVTPLSDFLTARNISLEPLFGVPEEHLKAEAAALAPTAENVPDLSVYYRVHAPDDQLESLAEQLRAHHLVEAAYVKPPGEPAVAEPIPLEELEQLNMMLPRMEDAPPTSPDFSARQGYLDAAPGGVDARYAWTQAGGGGRASTSSIVSGPGT